MRRKNIENQNLTEEERNQVQIEMLKQKILQAKANIDSSIGEIGMCLHCIKEQLPHGEWAKWLEDNVDYTVRTAQRYIKAFMFTSALPEELESKINMLGGTKLIELSSCKIDIAEDIVRTNDVKNISLTELKKIIKEKKSELKTYKKKNDIDVAFEKEDKKEVSIILNGADTKPSVDVNVDKIIEDTKKIIQEIEIRQGYIDNFEETLVARYNAKEITFNELNKVISKTKCDLPIFFKHELLDDYLYSSNEFYSNYEHTTYTTDKTTNERTSKTTYSILNDAMLNWKDNVTNKWYYDCEEEEEFKFNNIENKVHQIAELSDSICTYICIYKNYKLLASLTAEEYIDFENWITKLCDYDTNLNDSDKSIYLKMYQKLETNMKKYYEQKNIRFAKAQAKKKKYDEKFENWQKLYQPYSMGKYNFDDIWDDEGEIKNFKMWKEMCDFCDKQRKANYKEYENFNYNDWFGNGEKTLSIAEEDKPIYKKMYKKLAFEFHPDKMGGDGHAMQLVNDLKQKWGI
ncbi:DUF3102 domain-containing protein [Clostridium botulinum]|nr:DUF3102 domain-containing protein [Clostridium botulinum]